MRGPGSSRCPPAESGRDKKGINRAARGVLDVLPTILELAGDVSGNAGLPGLQAGISVLSKVVEKAQAASVNIDGIAELEGRVTKLAEVLNESRGKTVAGDMQRRINGLFSQWEEIGKASVVLKSRKSFLRYLRSDIDALELSGLIQKLNNSLQTFLFEGVLNLETMVRDMKIQQDESFMPPYAKNAQYGANVVRRACLKGTRVDILQQVWSWIDNALHLVEVCTARNGNIFWVNGMAGAGKTTIAFSVARDCHERGILGGCFFCSRFDAECSDPNLIFVTISRQLCRLYPTYKEKVIAALKHDPDIVNAGVLRQLEELIVRPLEALKGTLPPSVIVIDALDECKDQNSTSTILAALAKFIGRLAPLLFIITSRPEPRITALFGRSREDSLANVTTPILLHEVQLQSVLEDIKCFLYHGFDKIRSLFNMNGRWPSAQDVDQLARLSNGLFIFASTALAFIEDRTFLDPEGQLQSLLTRQTLSQRTDSIMDSLYSQILEESYPKISDALAGKLQTILGTITLAQEPLSTTGLAQLLGVSENTIMCTLSGLHSVLYIPEDNTHLIRVIHPTFPEFLLRESHFKKDVFYIRPAQRHLALVSRCFVVMAPLQRNILRVESPTLLKHEIPGLVQKIAKHLPPHLSYACRHWAAHLEEASGNGLLDDVFDNIQDFIQNRLFYWLEACSWLDALGSALSALNIAGLCFLPSQRFSVFVPTFIDCRRLALAYFACINDAPLQVYHSALSLAPRSSLVAQAYAGEIQHSPIVLQGGPVDWGPCIATISGGKEQTVYSIAFPPNGRHRFVTGGRDKTIGVWHSVTCTKILSIEGHRDSINSVSYSPDSSYITSGSDDKTVRLWDAESGAHIRTFSGHSDGVRFVTSSAGGTRVLSASRAGEVKLWDASDGRCLLTTRAWPTRQVSISRDGSLIAHGTKSSLCLLYVSTGEAVHLDLPNPGLAATFSPDCQYVAGATDTTIRIWRLSDRTLARDIPVPQFSSRIVFSHDGTKIGCGCYDGNVRLWQAATDDPPLVLAGHSNYISDLAWSLDGSHVVSACADGVLRVWDASYHPLPANTAEPRLPRPAHDGVPQIAVVTDNKAGILCGLSSTTAVGNTSGDVARLPEGAPPLTLCYTVAEAWNLAIPSNRLDALDTHRLRNRCLTAHAWEFVAGWRMFQRNGTTPSAVSQDGSLMAYMPSTPDRVVHIYDIRSGATVLTFPHRHSSDITAAAFSPDGTRLATGSVDTDVKIWDVTLGELVASDGTHMGRVESVAFSSDGSLLVSGDNRGIAHICDAATGVVLQSLKCEQRWPTFVFTPDDKAIMALEVWPDGFVFFVWDVASGACTHRLSSFDGTSWLHSVNFSPDDTGLVLGGSDDVIELWRPGERTWPVYTVDYDGWVYAKRPGRTQRLCWLPLEWRCPLSSDGDILCVFDYIEWKVVELDMSQLLQGAETWM